MTDCGDDHARRMCLPYRTNPPEVLFLVLPQPAQSESTIASICVGIGWCSNSCRVRGTRLMYLPIFFSCFHAPSVGFDMLLLASFALNISSARSCARKLLLAVMLLYLFASSGPSPGSSSPSFSFSLDPGAAPPLHSSRPRSLTTISACRWSASRQMPYSVHSKIRLRAFIDFASLACGPICPTSLHW